MNQRTLANQQTQFAWCINWIIDIYVFHYVINPVSFTKFPVLSTVPQWSFVNLPNKITAWRPVRSGHVVVCLHMSHKRRRKQKQMIFSLSVQHWSSNELCIFFIERVLLILSKGGVQKVQTQMRYGNAPVLIKYKAVQRTVRHSCSDETRLVVLSVPFPSQKDPNVFLP